MMNKKQIFIAIFVTNIFGLIISVKAKIISVPNNDTGTIQAAIETANTGDTIKISAGRYNENIILKSGITIEGAKNGKTVLTVPRYTQAVVVAIDAKNCIIRNLTIDGENQSFRKCYGLGLSLQSIANDIYISNIYERKLTSHYHLQTGMRIISVNGKPPEYIFLAGIKKGIFYLELQNDKRTIFCQLRNKIHPLYGKFTYRPDGIIAINSTITIENCSIKNLGGDGIVIMGKNARANISRNTIENNVYGIWFCWSACGLAQNNVCRYNRGAGIAITDEDTYAAIRHNSCVSNTLNGIYIGNSANGVVENNDCRNNKYHSIYIYQAGTEVKLLHNSQANP